jgi:hypothetical protein
MHYIIYIIVVILLASACVGVYMSMAKTEHFSPFTNFNLTDKPVANYAPYYIYDWWKFGLDRDRYSQCDQYRCQNGQFNQCTVKGELKGEEYLKVHDKRNIRRCDYYQNPQQYCAVHTEDERCPNHPFKI